MKGIMGLFPRYWLPIGFLSLVIAGNYRLRSREVGLATSGSIDKTILFEIGIYLFVFLGSYLSLEKEKKLSYSRSFLWAGIYVALLTISSFYTPYFTYGLVRSFEAVTILLFSYLVMMKPYKKALSYLTHAFVVLVSASTIYGFVFNTTATSGIQQGRFTWLALHPTVSSIFLALSIIITFTCLAQKEQRIWNFYTYTGVFLLLTYALIINETRGSAFAVMIGIVVISYFSFSSQVKTNTILWSIPVIPLFSYVFWKQILAFLTRGADVSNLATLNNRTLLWSVAKDAIEEKPWFGHGIGSSKGIFFEATGLGGGHNMFINVLVEVGFVGLFSWLACGLLVLGNIILMVRQQDKDANMMLGIYTVITVSGLFYDGPGAVGTVSFIWLFMLIALSSIACQSYKNNDFTHSHKRSFKTSKIEDYWRPYSQHMARTSPQRRKVI